MNSSQEYLQHLNEVTFLVSDKKEVNDQYAIGKDDLILKALSSIVTSILARLDEFILPEEVIYEVPRYTANDLLKLGLRVIRCWLPFVFSKNNKHLSLHHINDLYRTASAMEIIDTPIFETLQIVFSRFLALSILPGGSSQVREYDPMWDGYSRILGSVTNALHIANAHRSKDALGLLLLILGPDSEAVKKFHTTQTQEYTHITPFLAISLGMELSSYLSYPTPYSALDSEKGQGIYPHHRGKTRFYPKNEWEAAYITLENDLQLLNAIQRYLSRNYQSFAPDPTAIPRVISRTITTTLKRLGTKVTPERRQDLHNFRHIISRSFQTLWEYKQSYMRKGKHLNVDFIEPTIMLIESDTTPFHLYQHVSSMVVNILLTPSDTDYQDRNFEGDFKVLSITTLLRHAYGNNLNKVFSAMKSIAENVLFRDWTNLRPFVENVSHPIEIKKLCRLGMALGVMMKPEARYNTLYSGLVFNGSDISFIY